MDKEDSPYICETITGSVTTKNGERISFKALDFTLEPWKTILHDVEFDDIPDQKFRLEAKFKVSKWTKIKFYLRKIWEVMVNE